MTIRQVRVGGGGDPKASKNSSPDKDASPEGATKRGGKIKSSVGVVEVSPHMVCLLGLHPHSVQNWLQRHE